MSLEVISVNIWHILISLINLLIMFLIVKKFLYKPIKKAFETRNSQIGKLYSDARQAESDAEEKKQQYEQKREALLAEADNIISEARENADRIESRVLADAEAEAKDMLRRANEDIAQEKKHMINTVKNEVSSISVALASKMVEREINAQDHTALIDEFISQIGENDG